mgnify:CR=1 FL=1
MLFSLYHSRVNILAIDSSTEACSAALLCDDGRVFSEFEVAPRQHTRLLPAMMDAVIGAAGIARQSISHCSFANGPGAFTGIRIAAAQAQGIGIALGIPLIPISTLAVMAQAAFDRNHGDQVLVALDARMAEVYWALYVRDATGIATLLGEEKLSALDALDFDDQISYGVGHGWALQALRSRAPAEMLLDVDLLPDAASLLKLASRALAEGKAVAAGNISINYLRNQVALKAKS